MKIKMPEADKIGKASAAVQLILFFVLLVTIYFFFSKLVNAIILKVLIFVVDYVIVSLFTYLVIKPFFAKIEDKLRNK